MGKSIYDSQLYIEDLKIAMEHTLGKDKLDGATVMVTGASGTIGSFIVDILCEYGTKVIACGRNVDKLKNRFARFLSDPEKRAGSAKDNEFLRFCAVDILDSRSFNNLPQENVDYIIHAAGNAYPSSFIDHTDDTVKGNILGTSSLLQYGKKHGCKKFVYVSSGEVYSLDEGYRNSWFANWKEGNPFEYMKLVQDAVAEKGPRSCYPVSKVAAEAMVLEEGSTASDGMQTLIVRPCHTFGPGITGSDDRAHVQFAKKAVAGEDIVLNSAGTQLRSYNYVADAASGIISAMLVGSDICTGSDGSGIRSYVSGIFDICSRDNEITIRGLAELIAKVTGVSVTVKEADERQKSLQSPINKQILRPEDLESLGWGKAFDLEKGVSHYIQILLSLNF